MNVDSATFELLAEPPTGDWIVRVSVKGSGFVDRAIPLGARVGEIPVEGVLEDIDGTGFVGYLNTVPPEGAHLFVGYLSGELRDTGITYEAPNV